MGKVRTGLNLRKQAVTNPEPPVIQGCEWSIHKGLKAMTGQLGIKKKNISRNHSMKGLCRGNPAICRVIPPAPTAPRIRKKTHKSKFQGEWTTKSGGQNSRRKLSTVQVPTEDAPLPRMSEYPVIHTWNINPGTLQNKSRRRVSTTVLETGNPPMNDMRWNTWKQLASSAEATTTSKVQHKKGPFLCNTPERVKAIWEKPAQAPPHATTLEPEPPTAPLSPTNPPTTTEATSDEEWNELFNELLPQSTEERECTPPLIIPAQTKEAQENRWIRVPRKSQSPISRYIATEGKKIHVGEKPKRKRARKKKKEKGKGKGKAKEGEKGKKVREENTGIRKWFTPIKKTAGSDRAGAGEVRSTSEREGPES
jgi:hypothetical protein